MGASYFNFSEGGLEIGMFRSRIVETLTGDVGKIRLDRALCAQCNLSIFESCRSNINFNNQTAGLSAVLTLQ